MFRKLLSRRNLVSISLGLSMLAAMTVVLAYKGVLAATLNGDEDDQRKDVFYTSLLLLLLVVAVRELFAIEVSGGKVTTSDIGPINGGACASLALSPSGTLFGMCGNLFGAQQLATFDPKTGLANLFGLAVPGLAVMAMAFGPNGTLYAVGDCNPNGANFECSPGADPNYNSLYTVNEATGAFTRSVRLALLNSLWTWRSIVTGTCSV